MDKQQATWIWYPGDFEIWLGNRFNNRRTERGAMFPPFWKQDAHWPTVEFSKTVRLTHTEKVSIIAEGQFSLKIDGYLQFGMPDTFLIPRGEHHVNIKVYNPATPPALYIDGETIKSPMAPANTCLRAIGISTTRRKVPPPLPCRAGSKRP